MKNVWVSTYHCEDCKHLVQVCYKCKGGKHLVRVLRTLRVQEINCRECGKQISESGIFYSGNGDFIGNIERRIFEIEYAIGRLDSTVKVLSDELSEFNDFKQSQHYKKFISDKYEEIS